MALKHLEVAWSLELLATFTAMASQCSSTSFTHLDSEKPITEALKRNISLKLVGTCEI